MWPWGHLAVGYLLYALFARSRNGRAPGGPATVLLALGTQFPDLVDKPLAWTFGVLPTGRSLAHSLLVAAVVIVVLSAYCRRSDRTELANAFSIGYLSHLAADVLYPVLRGEFELVTFLLWPLLPLPVYDAELSFLAHLLNLRLTLSVAFEIVLGLVALGLWTRHGTPGFAIVRRAPARFYERLNTPR